MGHQRTKSRHSSNTRGHLITFLFPHYSSWMEGHLQGHFFTVFPLKGHPRGNHITFSLLEMHPKANFCCVLFCFFLTWGHQGCYHQTALPPLLQCQIIVFNIRVKKKKKLHTVCARQLLMCAMYFRLLPAVPRRFIRADWDNSVNEDIPSQIHGSLELG